MPAPPRLLLAGFCRCRCHDLAEAAIAEAAARNGQAVRRAASGAVAVKVTRADDAAAACEVCRDHHCAALSGRPEELETRHRPRAPTPAPAPEFIPPVAGADGYPFGGGEGPE